MYHTILIPVENSAADETILDHIKPLARMTGPVSFLCTSPMGGLLGILSSLT
jgi:hypothetical protein